MSLILFGFKGSGKSYLGKKLARLAQIPFIDTDEEMLKLIPSFTSLREYHKQMGEISFRRLEERVVERLEPSPLKVIALGGGTILSKKNKEHLEKLGRLVYVEAPLQMVLPRIHPSSSLGCIPSLYKERLPLYRAITPAHKIDLSQTKEEDVITILLPYLTL